MSKHSTAENKGKSEKCYFSKTPTSIMHCMSGHIFGPEHQSYSNLIGFLDCLKHFMGTLWDLIKGSQRQMRCDEGDKSMAVSNFLSEGSCGTANFLFRCLIQGGKNFHFAQKLNADAFSRCFNLLQARRKLDGQND